MLSSNDRLAGSSALATTLAPCWRALQISAGSVFHATVDSCDQSHWSYISVSRFTENPNTCRGEATRL